MREPRIALAFVAGFAFVGGGGALAFLVAHHLLSVSKLARELLERVTRLESAAALAREALGRVRDLEASSPRAEDASAGSERDGRGFIPQRLSDAQLAQLRVYEIEPHESGEPPMLLRLTATPRPRGDGSHTQAPTPKPMRITTPETVITGQTFRETIEIAARGCRVEGNVIDLGERGLYGVVVTPEGRGSIVRGNLISRAKSKGVLVAGYASIVENIIERCGADGMLIHGDYVEVRRNVVREIGTPGQHSDLIQIGSGRHLRVTGNDCTGNEHTNAGLYVEPDFGDIADLVVAFNAFRFGGYGLQMTANTRHAIDAYSIAVRRNGFSDWQNRRPMRLLEGVFSEGNYRLGEGPLAEAERVGGDGFVMPQHVGVAEPTAEDRSRFEHILQRDRG